MIDRLKGNKSTKLKLSVSRSLCWPSSNIIIIIIIIVLLLLLLLKNVIPNTRG